MNIVSLVGIAGMTVGLGIVITGATLAWKAESIRPEDRLRGSADFTDSLSRLMDSLARHPVGIRLVVLGIVLFFISGLVAAGGTLT